MIIRDNPIKKKILLALLLVFVLLSLFGCVTKPKENATYNVDISMTGGSGKAYIKSPALVTVKDGMASVRFVWSSKNYDYMIVNGTKYLDENEGSDSTFTVLLGDMQSLMQPLTVIGDTVAMSTPHEIEYTITFGELTLLSEDAPDNGASFGQSFSVSSKSDADNEKSEAEFQKLDLGDVTYELKRDYAKLFDVKGYKDYKLITINDERRYLLVPENKDIPSDIPDDVFVLKMPLDRTYMASSSCYDYMRQLGCTGSIAFLGTKENDWYIQDAKDKMNAGSILYAGKYSAPDYELLLSGGCDLAIENTMIYHKVEAMEKLQNLGIPVLVERSGYEASPLGKLEWIKLYGELFSKEKEAEEYFDLQKEIIENIAKQSSANEKKSVAFFYVNSQGAVVVRRPGDYVSSLIEMAGGEYAPGSIDEADNSLSTMNMQMEDFYLATADCDVLIYNSTIDGEIDSIDDLCKKNPLFTSYKAVKNKQVYCIGRNLFQETTKMAEFANDLYTVISGCDNDMTCIKRLN